MARHKGDGEISQTPWGTYQARLQIGVGADGKKKRISKTFKRKKDAQIWLRQQTHQRDRGTLAHAGSLSLAEWMEIWLAEGRSRGLAPRTLDSYESHMRVHLVPLLGRLLLSELQPAHISDLFIKLAGNGMSAATRSKVATTLRATLAAAVRQQLLAVNPALAVPKPRATRSPADDVGRVWSAEECRRFLEACRGHRLEALFVLALDTGMRQGELFGLHWPAVNLDRHTVEVRQALEDAGGRLKLKEPKSPASRRTIRITQTARDRLVDHRERMADEGQDVDSGAVFVGRKGTFLRKQTIRDRFFEQLLGQSKVTRIRFHDLRHTSATLLLAAGVNVKTVSRRLGHSSVRVTWDTYAHVIPEMESKLIRALEGILDPPKP